MGGLLAPTPVTAQTTDETTLIERYRMARYRVLARRYLRRMGRLPIYPPRPLPTPTDSLFPAPSSRDTATAERPAFPLHDVRPVRHLEQTWFRERFAETEWAFLGETPRPTFFDTTRTLDLRARLQAQFGSPTRTLADKPLRKPPGERPQFEYWFVVNDSIPVQVMDVRGPKGRGLIVAADQAYRDRLPALRRALLAPLRHSLTTSTTDAASAGIASGLTGTPSSLNRFPVPALCRDDGLASIPSEPPSPLLPPATAPCEPDRGDCLT
ncbi:MAG: hypothetical protein ABEK84_08285 [Salinibacter sp.]